MMTYDPSWMITEPVLAKMRRDFRTDSPCGDAVHVEVRKMPDAPTRLDTQSPDGCALRFDGENLTFDRQRIEVHDDFMAYLNLMDEAIEADGKWIISEPYDEGDG